MSESCNLKADDVFGPQVHSYRNDYDFTLLFEQSILVLLPSTVFIVALVWRARQLHRQDAEVPEGEAPALQRLKQAAAALLVASQLVLLVLWCSPDSHRTQVSIAAAVISLVDSVAILLLSSVEHSRSIRPSVVINLYLFLSVLFDVPQVRTLLFRDQSGPVTIMAFIGLVLKMLMLLLESRSKQTILLPAFKFYPPEIISGIWSRISVWWLNPLFMKGSGSTLSSESLYAVDSELLTEVLRKKFQRKWAGGEFTQNLYRKFH